MLQQARTLKFLIAAIGLTSSGALISETSASEPKKGEYISYGDLKSGCSSAGGSFGEDEGNYRCATGDGHGVICSKNTPRCNELIRDHQPHWAGYNIRVNGTTIGSPGSNKGGVTVVGGSTLGPTTGSGTMPVAGTTAVGPGANKTGGANSGISVVPQSTLLSNGAGFGVKSGWVNGHRP
jgi:hypothetical protein